MKCSTESSSVTTGDQRPLTPLESEMLGVLRLFTCIDFDHFTEHDELLLTDVKREAAAAIAKATHES